jgi:hypothetical protein
MNRLVHHIGKFALLIAASGIRWAETEHLNGKGRRLLAKNISAS